MRSSLVFVLHHHHVILVLTLDPFIHPCVARVLIFNHVFYPSCESVCLLCISVMSLFYFTNTKFLLCQQDPYVVRNNFHPKQPSPEVSTDPVYDQCLLCCCCLDTLQVLCTDKVVMTHVAFSA